MTDDCIQGLFLLSGIAKWLLSVFSICGINNPAAILLFPKTYTDSNRRYRIMCFSIHVFISFIRIGASLPKNKILKKREKAQLRDEENSV